MPPIVRALPHVESLSLFPTEEGQEELEARRNMGIATMNELLLPVSTVTRDPVDAVPAIPTQEVTNAPPAPTASSLAIMQKVGESNQPIPATRSISNTMQKIHASVNDEKQRPYEAWKKNDVVIAAGMEDISVEPVASSTSSTVAGRFASQMVTPMPVMQPVAVVMEDDADEPMPGINMDSDSD